ncbi:type VI secretion system baseplate subunit TssG [Labrenzia sp. 011]|uniref:type VI secretion system baseplate subunit TssG n=1 Tax=Labrenzia sp. 011 TaxID=2171494 RepID=UPI0014021770|nr:type VI secretion system baseplate subunit TssG [Labrenzia sp. 011]
MSGADDKDPEQDPDFPDRPTARDKTVLRLADSAPAVWPDDRQPFPEASDTDAPAVEAVAEPDVPPAGEALPDTDDAILSQAMESPAGDLPEPPAPASPADTGSGAEDAHQLTGSAAEDHEDIFGDKQDAEPEAETPPPAEPRIEVPVQQQYASLLSALSARIEKHPGGHDLLAVLRMLEGQTAPGAKVPGLGGPAKTEEPAPPRIGKSRRLMEDIVRFGQDPSSEFATSTIERATRDNSGGLVLLERFLGLLGPQGALPAPYTDEAIMWGLRGNDEFPRFLDVFNNRFIQLFYRAWADARPIVQHDRPDDDRFLAYIGSSIGLGAPIYRDLDRIDDRLKLLYAGQMAPKTKSAARLKALISGVFGVKVEIDQCVGTWLHLDRDDQLSLGGLGPGGAGRLGADTIVGARVYSVSDKIRIRIFTRSLDEYRKFLPPTRSKPNPWTEKLFDLIDFYLGLEIEYEIELALPRRCASSVQMNRNSSATLGHIGWLKPPAGPAVEDADIEEEDEDMLTDTRFRPVRRHTSVYQ